MAHVGQEIALGSAGCFGFLDRHLQPHLGLLSPRNVARDAKRSENGTVGTVQRNLVRQHPGDMPVRLELVLFLANAQDAGPHDLLFVRDVLLRPVRIEEIAIGLADGLRRVVQAKVIRQRLTDANEPTVLVLEVNEIRRLFHQRGQQESLEGQFLLHATSLGDLPPEFVVGRRQLDRAFLDASLQLFLRFPQRLLRAFAVGDVAHHRLEDAATPQVDANQQHIGREIAPVGAPMRPFEPSHAMEVGLRDVGVGRGARVRSVRLIRRRKLTGMTRDELLLRATAKQTAASPGCIR